jgi:hypothetical protein
VDALTRHDGYIVGPFSHTGVVRLWLHQTFSYQEHRGKELSLPKRKEEQMFNFNDVVSPKILSIALP